MKDIVIIGAGGFGREVAWLIEEINSKENEWNLLGFVDDNDAIQGNIINDYPVVGNIDWLLNQEINVVCAVADPLLKKEIITKLKVSRNRYPVLIHPSVIYSRHVQIGEGSIICAANIITTNILIGEHVIINLDCTIGHDAIISDYCTILPSVNISGYVELGECVSVGTGTQIIQGKCICKESIIGAGSVIVKDIVESGTYVGAPAKLMNRK